jgi:hypothetical protein
MKSRAPFAQSKTIFYNEVNPVAMLIIEGDGKHSQRTMKFGTAEAALGWCRDNGAILFYMPVRVSSN